MRILLIISILLFTASSCAPYSITRTGKAYYPKDENCEIDILKPEQTPDQPYIDIGNISLNNCQDYTTGLCLKYLKKAACELGANVAYEPTDLLRDGRDDTLAGQVTVTLKAAVYVSMQPPEDDDPVLSSTPKKPSCDSEQGSDT
ncbi:MAG: hypothetical protein JXR91_05580, partial [Deltaproteobacteria bacterium]|nr:hypothetical protein [Deltaproteobacteria bacterium]